MIKKRNLQAFLRSKWYVHTLFGSRDRAIIIQKFEQSCIPNYSPFALFWASYMNEILTAPGFPYEISCNKDMPLCYQQSSESKTHPVCDLYNSLSIQPSRANPKATNEGHLLLLPPPLFLSNQPGWIIGKWRQNSLAKTWKRGFLFMPCHQHH